MPPHRPDASHGQGTKRSAGKSSGRGRANMADSRRTKKELLAHRGEQEFYLDRQSVNPLESVASLVQRLGTPPQDLVDYLSSQFEVICQSKASGGTPLQRVNLAEWVIDSQGKLLFTGDDARDETRHARQGAPETRELIDQFTERLTASRETMAERRDRKEVQPPRSSLVGRLDRQSDDESTSPLPSEDLENQREQLIATFTAALADRFGPDVLADPEGCEEPKSRLIKLQPLERDRRFNWNLVLGVGTAAAVVALIWTGFQVSKIRHQRVTNTVAATTTGVDSTQTGAASTRADADSTRADADSTRADADSTRADADSTRADADSTQVGAEATQAGADSTRVDADSTQAGSDSTPVGNSVPHESDTFTETTEPARPTIADDVPKSFEFFPGSAFNDNEPSHRTTDVMDELKDGLPTLPRADPSESAPAEWDGALDPDASPAVVVDTESALSKLDSYFPNLKDAEFDSKSTLRPPVLEPITLGDSNQTGESNQTLRSVLDGDEPDGEAPELPQETRPTMDRFIDLPSATDTEAETIIDESGVAIRQLEFPFEAPIRLSKSAADGGLNLVDQQHGNLIARLTKDDTITRFRWTEDAAKGKSAEQLIHGRLIDEKGGSIFLRPTIEADAYCLSLSQRRRRPSWAIGSPIVTDLARLNLDLAVPDSMDIAWKTPFNPTRPRRGAAVVILSPKDGESVEIAIKFDVDCSRKLTCRMQFAGRLGPNMPWQLMTEQGFRSQANLIQNRRRNLAIRHEQFQRQYDAAGLTERRLLKRNKDEIEQAQEQLELAAQRMQMLGALFIEMESKVTLTMHLYVQWPDSQQTILRTVSQNTAK